MSCCRVVALLALTCATLLSGAHAQDSAQAADHDALRRLKAGLESAVSKRDFDALGKLVQPAPMVTVVTQDSFSDLGAMKRYYDSLFTRDVLRMKDFSLQADADELSSIHTGTFAMTRGSTKERYVLADGRSFDMNGRWTAVSLRQPDGSWKLLGIHMGTNFLDNPVLSAIERSVLWIGLGGGAAGLLAGLAGGWWLGRRRALR